MECFMCKGELIEKKVNYMVDLEKTIIIIKDVPAKVCDQCGEQYFDDETSQNIEKIVASISLYLIGLVCKFSLDELTVQASDV